MKKHYIFFLAFQCLFLGLIQAQTTDPYFLPKIFPKTPNSAALERYGNYQVNLFTGVPEISIPLYEIQVGQLKVPISLSYHASGVKVNDVASWVGLGWSLNAGGEVTRRVMGNRADESSLTGYLFVNLRHPSTITMNNEADLRYLDDIRNGIIDVEPDIFSYNFPGKSGKFFFNRMGTDKIQLVPFSPVRINRKIISQGILNNLSFKINDDQGNEFNFGESEREISNIGQPTSVASAWMLEKMISQNKADTISFSYVGSTLSVSDITMYQTVSDNIQSTSSATPFGSGWDTYPTSNPSLSATSQKQLEAINFKNGKVSFGLSTTNRQDVPDANVKSLSLIKVLGYNYSSGQYDIQKTITLHQSYFTGATIDYSTKRLRLDSITVADAQGIVVQRYRFEYDNSLSMPPYNSLSKDYWGYFNNRTNSSLIPQQQVSFQAETYSTNITIGSDNPIGRVPDSNFLKLGMLKKMVFPTGGHTDFEYGINRYVENGNIKLAGGLRIESIKSYDGINAAPVVKRYTYDSARKNFILENFSFQKEQTHRYYGHGDVGLGTVRLATKRLRTFLSTPTIDPLPFDGATVVYPVVTEYEGDVNTNAGKTVLKFRDRADLTFATAPVWDRPVVNSFFYARGQLSERSSYRRNNGGSYSIVSREVNNYTAFPETGYDQVVGLSAVKNVINDGDFGSDVYLGVSTSGSIGPGENDLNSYSYLGYPILADDNYLTSQTSTTFDQKDTTKFVTSTKEHIYNNIIHQQINRIITTDSKNQIHEIINKFPADYIVGQATSTGNAVIDSMLSKNLQSALIETYEKITSDSVSNVVSGKLNAYKFANSNSVELDSIKTLEIVAAIAGFQPSTIVAGYMQKDQRYNNAISFDSYDSSGNLMQYTPRNGAPITVLYDYKKQYPIAEIKNAVQNDVAYTSFEANGTGNWSGINSGSVQTTGGFTGKKVYSLSGTTIAKTGLTTTKNYIVSYWTNGGAYTITGTISGGPKQLMTVTIDGNQWTNYEHKISGVSAVSISGAGALDELKLYPAEAQMTTYTYDPLIGMTSLTDAKNFTSYYDYDGFGRLKNIRDYKKNIVKNYTYSYADTIGSPSLYNPDSLENLLANYKKIQPGRMNSFFHPASVPRDGSIKDPKLFFRNGVAQLPEEYRTMPPTFYSALNLNLYDPYVSSTDPAGFCFMKDGYSVEWRMKMPHNSYNGDVWHTSVLFNFMAIFKNKYDGESGTYLYGYKDLDGDSAGNHFGARYFTERRVDTVNAFANFQNIKLQVTKTRYNVYYNDSLIVNFPKDSTRAIDSHFYADASFFGNDGSVDFVKVYDNAGNLKFVEDFNDPDHPSKPSASLVCTNVSCEQAFANYFNQRNSTSYTFSQIDAIYLQTCGRALNVCL